MVPLWCWGCKRMSVEFLQVEGLCPDADGQWPALDLRVDEGITLLLAANRQRGHRYLRLLGGVDPAVQGSIRLLGEEHHCLDREAWLALRRYIGYLLEGAPLLSVLSVADNLLLPGLYHGVDDSVHLNGQALRLLERLGVHERLDVLPAWLRDDERRAVGLVRCLLLEPRLLLLESPLAGLDLRIAGRTRELLRDWVGEARRAVVVADNDMALARVADSVVVLGREACYSFNGWEALCADRHPEVCELRDLLVAESCQE